MTKHCLTKLFFFTLAGFNVETIDYKGTNFTAWDIGGRDKTVCFLLDSTLPVLSFHFVLINRDLSGGITSKVLLLPF